MIIDTNGNVGIGTATPVNNTNWAGLTLSGTTGGQIDFQDDGTTVGAIYNGTWGLAVQAVSGKELRLYGGGGTALTLEADQDAVFAGSWIYGNRAEFIPETGAYDQIKIASVSTNNTNKGAGIYTLNYSNNNTSIMQYSTNSGGNTVYYGSADGNYRGLTAHRFYVNASPTATSGHTQALYIAGDTNALFAGTVTATGGNSTNLITPTICCIPICRISTSSSYSTCKKCICITSNIKCLCMARCCSWTSIYIKTMCCKSSVITISTTIINSISTRIS
jgi:hypothetical protein